VTLTTCALGQNKTWNNGVTAGTWNVPSNWLPAAVPIANDVVNLLSSDGFARTVTYVQPASLTLGTLTINATNGGVFNLNIGQDTLTSNFVNLGTTGSAIVNQTGGTFTTTAGNSMIIAGSSGSNGTYSLSAGTLLATYLSVGNGGSGTFLQSGGYVGGHSGIASYLSVSPNSTSNAFYSMTGGTINLATASGAGTLQVGGGSALFQQSAGTISNTNVIVGSSYGGRPSVYHLSGNGVINGGTFGGVLNLSASNGAATFSQSGGTITMAQLITGGNSTFNHSGGTFTFGSITMNGGTIIAPADLYVGTGNVGGLNLYGGSLSTSQIFLSGNGTINGTGANGTASFGNATLTQNGGFVNSLRNTGYYAYNAGTYSGELANLGIVEVNTPMQVTTLTNTGTIAVSSQKSLAVSGNFNNNGLITTAGSLVSPSSAILIGQTGSGTITQLGGSVSSSGSGLYVGHGSGIAGHYQLGSGTLTANAATIGYNASLGYMRMTAGLATFANSMHITSTGSLEQSNGGVSTNIATMSGGYILSTGSLSVGSILTVNGGSVSQNSGAVTVGTTAGSINLLGNGQYNLFGGTLAAATLNLSSGTFHQANGGFLSAGNIVQSGATVTGRLTNFGTFTYNSGLFLGRLVNQGTLVLNAAFNAGNGMENYGTFTVPLNRTYNFDGAGLLNAGTLNFTGGIVTGTGSLTNDFAGLMTGTGSVYTTLVNNGNFTLSGLFSVGGNISNAGLITIGAFNLRPSANLGNVGIIDLTGGAITGTGGTFTNQIGGVIQGRGAIAMPLANHGLITAQGAGNSLLTLTNLLTNTSGGELRVADGNAMTVQTAFTSNGLITLNGANAAMNGGSISNGGSIVGQGRVTNTISNNGVIRAAGGQLQLTALGNSNSGAGRIEVLSGATLFATEGFNVNNGVISLVGGVFDNNSRTMTNNGIVAGKGTFRSSGLTNGKLVSFADGPTDIFGPFTNTVSGPAVTLQVTNCTTTFYDNVVNGAGAVVKNTGGVIRFLGSFTNNGVYTSDPADNYFSNITNGPTGVLEGGVGDRFFISGTFQNEGLFNTTGSLLQTANLINSGTLNLIDGDLIVAGTVTNFGQISLGGDLGFASPLSFNLTGGTLLLVAGPRDLLCTRAISIAGSAVFDIGENDILIDYTGTSPQSDIRSHILSGAIRSDAAGVRYAVGYAETSEIAMTSIDGKSVDESTVVLRYTLKGDANLDLEVDSIDLNRFVSGYGSSMAANWSIGDFNGDGRVNTIDFNHVSGNFGQTAGMPSLGASVPEPTLLAMLATTGILVVRRRCRSSN
jgi:hypothetical protein